VIVVAIAASGFCRDKLARETSVQQVSAPQSCLKNSRRQALPRHGVHSLGAMACRKVVVDVANEAFTPVLLLLSNLRLQLDLARPRERLPRQHAINDERQQVGPLSLCICRAERTDRARPVTSAAISARLRSERASRRVFIRAKHPLSAMSMSIAILGMRLPSNDRRQACIRLHPCATIGCLLGGDQVRCAAACVTSKVRSSGGRPLQPICARQRQESRSENQEKRPALACKPLTSFGSPTWARTRDLRINSHIRKVDDSSPSC
jgi:hypothetical protein